MHKNITLRVISLLLLFFPIGIGAMEKKEIINSPHFLHKSANYGIIAIKNAAFFCDIKKNTSIILKDYIPSKYDIMTISDDGKVCFILEKKKLSNAARYRQAMPTEAQVYSTDSGEIISKIMVPVYDEMIFGDGGYYEPKKISCLLSYENSIVSMKCLNGSHAQKTVTSLKNNLTLRNGISTIIEAGEKYYVSTASWGNNSVTSMLQICSFNKDVPIIPILYGKYFRSTTQVLIFDEEQTENLLHFAYLENDQANIPYKRRCPPLSIQFTPHDEYIILKYINTTDVIKLDQNNHTIDGIVLPFSGNFMIKNGTAQVVSEEDDETEPYFLYQEGACTDNPDAQIHEEYDEIFITDSHKKTKYYSFKAAKDRNNNPTLVIKKIPTQQEKLLTHTNHHLFTDVDFEFLAN